MLGGHESRARIRWSQSLTVVRLASAIDPTSCGSVIQVSICSCVVDRDSWWKCAGKNFVIGFA